MPRFQIDKRKEGDQPQNIVGQIKQRIKDNMVVPLISNTISNNLVLGGHDKLVSAYAKHIEYPPPLSGQLLQMTQFRIVTNEEITDSYVLEKDYINFVKNRLCDIAEREKVSQDTLDDVYAEFDTLDFAEFSERLGYPKFDKEENDPLLILADLDLPVFLTTSYHGFIEAALKKAGKKPETEICRWHEDLVSIPSIFDGDYKPSIDRPLVYHLYGFDEHAKSLVLTEDDYLKFLVTVSGKANVKNEDPIHTYVRRVISRSSLVLVGYGLRSWDFRTLFWGLIEPKPTANTSFSIQLEPSEAEKSYLQKYLKKVKFEVYWGSIEKFAQELLEA